MMEHQLTEQEKGDSPSPATTAPGSTNGINEAHPEGIAGISFAGFNAAMAAGLAGAHAIGLSNEDYQKFMKVRQQQLEGMNEFLALQQQQQQLQMNHFRQFLQNQQDQQNAAKNHLRQQLEERHHNDLMNQVLNKDKSLESANASTAVKKHLQNFVMGRRKIKTYDGYSNNVSGRGLRWTPSLDTRNGIHDLSAPYPHVFDKKNSFPLRKTASEPNLKVRSKLRHKVTSNDRRCSPLLSRNIAASRAEISDHIRRKLNNDQGNADNSASNSAPNSGPSSPLNSNSNINNSSTGSMHPAMGIGLHGSGGSETELPAYHPLVGFGPKAIHASPSLPNISLELSQKKSNPNALLAGSQPRLIMAYPDSELQRLAISRTASLPFVHQTPSQQFPFKPVAPMEIDTALVQQLILQQQFAGVGVGVPSAEKDTPGPIRHSQQARAHKALSRTHSAPTTFALQQHLQKKRLMMHHSHQPPHKHAPHIMSGLSAEHYWPLTTHPETSERTETSPSSSKQRKQKLAASPPPTHPSAISNTTVQALQSHLNKHSNKGINQFPKQSDSRKSPPTRRHSPLDRTATAPETLRSHMTVKQHHSGDDKNVVVIKREVPDPSDELSDYPTPGHRDHPAVHENVQVKPSPLQARRSLLEGELVTHKPLARTRSSPAVSVSQKRKHKNYRYTTGLAYDPVMLHHGCACGDAHAEHAGRLKEVWSRLTQVGLTDKCELIEARKATMEELQLAHTQEHTIRYGATTLARQQSVVSDKFIVLPCGGVGVDIDTVWNEQHTINAARMAVGLTVDMALSVAANELKNGFAVVRPPGHHAEKNLAMAFCYFNSVAIAARRLQRMYPEKIRRVLIVDWDVHHCNGTQNIFYDDDSILVISIHRYDEGNFFPGTGAPDETGSGSGVGYNVNIGFTGGLEPPIGDADYLAAFRSVVMPIAEEFKPDFVFISAGFSAAEGHPSALGGYNVTPQCFSYLTKRLSQLADGHLVMVLEGGFELKSLCDCVEISVRTLLANHQENNNSLRDLPQASLNQAPCENAVRSINRISRFQERYWCKLKRMSAYINVSHATYLDLDPEDRACVAIASLTVEHPKHSDTKVKLREVLTRTQASKSTRHDSKSSSQEMNEVVIEHENPRLAIISDESEDMRTQNREEAMSAESSPLDVVGLSSPSSESPAPSPNNPQPFITSESIRNSPLARSSKANNSGVINEEPMEHEDSDVTSNGDT